MSSMKTTLRDVAERVGTTTGVVSVALNGAKSKTLRVSDETRQKVLQAAAELGYRRDLRGTALATGRSHVIGLMLPYVGSFKAPDPFYSIVTAGVAAGAYACGYNLMLYTAVAEEEGERAAESVDRRIDGLVLVTPLPGTPVLDECRRLGIATVCVDQFPAQEPLTVNADDYHGGLLAVNHLLELGHRRIAHLYGHEDNYQNDLRFRGYRDSLSRAGIEFDPDLVLRGGFQRNMSLLSTRKLLALPDHKGPTAIFAINDLAAHGALEAIAEAGLEVPNDISVVGYDDTWYASITNPPLTSVCTNVDQIGRRAAELLIAKLQGRTEEAHLVIPVSLTMRRSSGPPRHSKGQPQ
jgi:LacI family transcriptional regulator